MSDEKNFKFQDIADAKVTGARSVRQQIVRGRNQVGDSTRRGWIFSRNIVRLVLGNELQNSAETEISMRNIALQKNNKIKQFGQ